MRTQKALHCRLRTAYHEAGHAAIYWFFGTHGDLGDIDMRPDEESLGRVYAHGDMRICTDPRNIDPSEGPIARSRAIMVLMRLLAGDCASARVISNDSNWFDWRFQERIQEVGFWIFWDSEDGADFSKAVKIAAALYGQSTKAQTFLRRVGKWTDECLSHPRMWPVVAALGDELVRRDFVSYVEALKIMQLAWGQYEVLPYRVMGTKWRRRLEVPRGRM